MAKRHGLLAMAGLALGCATAPLSGPVDLGEAVRTHEPVYGPGMAFETIDEAAIDGLAWCYLKSRREKDQRVRGGSVRPVLAGGYTYDEIATARASTTASGSVKSGNTTVAAEAPASQSAGSIP